MSAKDTLSPKALRLILEHEVGGGEGYYNAVLARPNWPGGKSGVTIGVGYDLGYTARERFLGDWAALDDAHRARLSRVIGIKGFAAKLQIPPLRDIRIPWAVAFAVFQSRTVPYWIALTKKAFPRSVDLPDDAFGALVSLVFNRGPALTGKDREDMNDIYMILADGVQSGDQKLIADQLREMKRIWKGKGQSGLIARREAEARLVEGAR
jgi:hypothetical protein